MQMKTQFNNTLGWFTGGSEDGMTPGTHGLIQSITDPNTNLEYQKINFAFLFMPVDGNQEGKDGATGTAYPHINLNYDIEGRDPITSNENLGPIGVIKSQGEFNYSDIVPYPSLVGNGFNGKLNTYESVYLLIGTNIPGIGNCLMGSIGYYDGYCPQ